MVGLRVSWPPARRHQTLCRDELPDLVPCPTEIRGGGAWKRGGDDHQ